MAESFQLWESVFNKRERNGKGKESKYSTRDVLGRETFTATILYPADILTVSL